MRLIKTLHNHKIAQELSAYLKHLGIDHQLDVETNTDWGSNNYGDTTCRLWVIEEEQVEKAIAETEKFFANPQAALANISENKKGWLAEPLKEKFKEAPQKIKEVPLKIMRNSKMKPPKAELGTITTAILIICTLLLFISTLTTPSLKNIPENLPYYGIISTPKIEKILMYDYPEAYTILDKVIQAFGIDSLQNGSEISPQEQILINKFTETPYWKGFYSILVDRFSHPESPMHFNAPLFEKIREGQFWRLVTPIFLHYDIFHLFFNMIWLIIIGKQIEERLGAGRYILFILIAGIFSNTIQYLMGGPNFLGFSGVLCGMLTFIWIRQKRAAWEGYQLQSSTFIFIMAFIIAMFALQLVSFFTEIYAHSAFSPGIANAAHLSGAAIGLLLGSLDIFAYKRK